MKDSILQHHGNCSIQILNLAITRLNVVLMFLMKKSLYEILLTYKHSLPTWLDIR